MENKWYETAQVSAIWTILRVYLGVQWLTAGWGKVTGGFDAGGFIQGAIGKASGENPTVQGWYAAFLENVAAPNSGLFSFLVQWGELLTGLGLIIGLATVPALIASAFMSANFLMAGTISSNANLLIIAFILLLARRGSYYWGADRFAIPYVKELLGKNKEGNPTVTKG